MRAFAAGDLPNLLLRALPGLSLLQPGGNLLQILVALVGAVLGASGAALFGSFRRAASPRQSPPEPRLSSL